jgi:DNA-directed RNA polymerase specialized sigma24 family protein
VQGLEYQQMTIVTGASVPALKMRVARACEQLRERLKEVHQ